MNLFIRKPFAILICACCILASTQPAYSQQLHPIWGTPNNNSLVMPLGRPLMEDPNWGVVPSQQAVVNRPTNNISRETVMQDGRRLRIGRDENGRRILMDANGQAVRDSRNNFVDVDAVQGSQPSTAARTNDFAPPPPPDDPMDVPIDGGVSILLALGLVVGYQQSRRPSHKKIAIHSLHR